MTETLSQGARVRLRSKDWQDVQRDYEWSRDPELARLDATWPTTLSLAEYISGYGEELHRPSQGRYRFALETLDGQHIGNCMFYDMSEETKQTELGILIGDRAFWDRGYGSEATCLLVDYIFKTTHVERIYLHTLDWNTRAQKGFQKCGFVARGRRQRDGYSFIMMDITREAWQERGSKLRDPQSTSSGDHQGQPQGK